MAAPGWTVWAGWGISIVVSLLFLVSGGMKLWGIDAVQEGMAQLGLPLSMLKPLGMLEIACAVVYVIPGTAVLGAVLLTGHLGGAICAHWRIGDPFLPHVALGLLVWLGVYLREERLRALLPVRRR